MGTKSPAARTVRPLQVVTSNAPELGALVDLSNRLGWPTQRMLRRAHNRALPAQSTTDALLDQVINLFLEPSHTRPRREAVRS